MHNEKRQMDNRNNRDFHGRSYNRLCCPYGGLSPVPAIFGFAAFFFSMISFYGCDTFLSTSYDGLEEKMSIGYFTLEDSIYKQNATIVEHVIQRCVTYPDSTLIMVDDDTLWIFLRYFIAALTLIGTIILAFVCVMGCNCCSIVFPRKYVIVFGAIIVIFAQSHLLLLAGMKSNICAELACKPGYGTYCIGIATILWMCVGCAIFCMKDKTYPDQQSTSESASPQQQPTRVTNPTTRETASSSSLPISLPNGLPRPQYPPPPLLGESSTSSSVSTTATAPSVVSGGMRFGIGQSRFHRVIEEPIATLVPTYDQV